MEADEVLLERVRRGETAAFDELYRRYSRRLFGYIQRHLRDREEAEDLFQEVFFSVLHDRGARFGGPGRFGGWLFTVARNACLDRLRGARRRELRDQALQREAGPSDPSPEERLSQRQRVEQIRSALGALAPAQQEVLVLKQLGELTYQQVAAVLGVPEGTVKSRLHLAVRELQRRVALSEGGAR